VRALPGDGPQPRTIRCAQLIIALVLGISAFELRHEIAALWSGPRAHQPARYEHDVFLQRVDRLLPRDASVLLLTPGTDVRHREYTTFHRALYLLTPRPVWWLTPAASDSTWESRWWISAPLTQSEIRRVAAEKGATHLITIDGVDASTVERNVADLSGGQILALADDHTFGRPLVAPAATSAALPRLWPLRVTAAWLAIFLLGDVVLAVATRCGLSPTRLERGALAWALGAGVTSIAMLWLGAVGATLTQQVAIISITAVVGSLTLRLPRYLRPVPTGDGLPSARPFNHLRSAPAARGHAASSANRAVAWGAVAVLLICVLLVVAAAMGRPLTVWDSWVLWGMRARTMFVEGGLSPVIYADPSRLVTLPSYPLLVPSLQAWVYTWLGAAEDRLAGTAVVPFYLALPAIAYAALRRRGARYDFALATSATLAAVPAIVRLAAGVLADLPVAVFTAIAAIYIVEWIERTEVGSLIVAAFAAGLLPWTKQEGAVVVATLVLATLIVARGRRMAWLAVMAMCGAVLVLSGPWYAWVARHGLKGPQFAPVSVALLIANLGRVPSIGWHAMTTLLNRSGGWVWPAACIFAVVSRPVGAAAHPSAILLLTGALYAATMASVYLFSEYAPYQQHIVSSYPRLMAHVAALPLLWIACHAVSRR
jgi:hypothetical protein